MPRQSVEEQEVPNRKQLAGNKLVTHVPEGTIVTDLQQKKWRIGKAVGVGGFGEIYLAFDDVRSKDDKDSRYVAKVEAHTNGPLFVEMHFYLRAARREMVDEWVARQDLKFLGMPFYHASGSFNLGMKRFRFLVIPRYSHDLERTFQDCGRRFHLKTVLTVALQVLDTLEFIHEQGYVHADIKASNLLVGLDRDEQDRVFLVDFGLATLYEVEGVHKDFNPDQRKAHDGTLEFTSRDAHQGAHSRRGDLEVLGYNMLQWLCSRLPWECDNPNPEYVHAQKDGFMKDPASLVRACFPNSQPPVVLEKYMKYVASLEFKEKPDYDHCRRLFRQGLKEAGFKDDGRLELHSIPKAHKKLGKRRAQLEPENIGELKPKKVVRITPAQPCRPKNCNTRATRSSPTSPMLRSKEHFDWERVLQSNPEKKFYKRSSTESGGKAARRSEKSHSMPECRSTPSARRAKNLQELKKMRGLDNPTPAMLQVLGAKKQKIRSSSGQTTPFKRGRSESICSPSSEEIPTPAMEEVMQQRLLQRSQSCSPEPVAHKIRGRKHSAAPQQSQASVSHTSSLLQQASRKLSSQRQTRAMSHQQSSLRTRVTSARPNTLDVISSRLDASDGEENRPVKSTSSENNKTVPSIKIISKTHVVKGRLRDRNKGKQPSSNPPSVSPAKVPVTPNLLPPNPDLRASRRLKKEESSPIKSKTEEVLKNDMQFRLKVLMSIDECSSYAPSTVSSGSLYEPSDSDDIASLDSLHIRLKRAGKKKWRVDNVKRVLKMCPSSQRRVTRNHGKL